MGRPNRRAVRALAIVAMVVLAGCGGTTTVTQTGDTPTGATASPETDTVETTPSTDPTATATATPTNPESVEVDGSLSVNATKVWLRVQATTGQDVAPPTVETKSDVARLLSGPQVGARNPAFLRDFGVVRPEDPVATLGRSMGGLTERSAGKVTTSLYVGENVSDRTVECLVAHEFAHAVQFRRGHDRAMLSALREAENPPTALERRAIYRALVEGGAMYVQRAYAAEYGCSGASPYAGWVRNGTAWTEQVAAPYYYGERYANATLDSPTDLASLAEDPPTTTEQLLHPGSDDAPTSLAVDVETEGDWVESSRVRMGELWTRIALSAELSDRRAAAAAEGWGNDTLVRVLGGSDRGWVWVTDWDDASEAAEFADRVAVVSGPAGMPGNVSVGGGTTVEVTVGA